MSEGKKEILLGDCLELMNDIPNGSIDMILCDLPYGTTGCKWDAIIPFDKLWEQYERVIKENGAIILTASQPFSSALVMSKVELFRYRWIWEKEQGGNFQLAKLQPLNTVEDVLVFSKGKTANGAKNNMLYYPIMTPNEKPTKSGGTPSVSDLLHKNNMVALKKTYTESYPKSILRFNKEHSSKRLHETQKPVPLFEYLIKTYTKENDLVLDNCAGSGTTAIACLKTNRQFIVMEKEQKYYDIILKRVGDFNKKFETQTLFGNEM
jgi:site-specific DNA-methyltransferase (adenine-specific)